MYVVLVQLTVRPEMLADFERLLMHNARESVARDRGCLRFDVSQHVDDPTRWVLHEVYDVPESHAAQAIAAFRVRRIHRDAVIEGRRADAKPRPSWVVRRVDQGDALIAQLRRERSTGAIITYQADAMRR